MANARNKKKTVETAGSNAPLLFIAGAAALFLFLCDFGICGPFGDLLRYFMFGTFGLPAYIVPPLAFLTVLTVLMKGSGRRIKRKLYAGAAVLVLISMICELSAGRVQQMHKYSLPEIYLECGRLRNGGGVLAGTLAFFSHRMLSVVGTVLLLLVGFSVCAVILTDGGILIALREGSYRMADLTSRGMRDMHDRSEQQRRRNAKRRRLLQEERRLRIEQNKKQQRLRIEQKEDEKILRRDRRGSGVTMNTTLERGGEEEEFTAGVRDELFIPDGRKLHDDVHEIMVHHYGAEDAPELASPTEEVEEEEDIFSIRGNVREIVREEETVPQIADAVREEKALPDNETPYNAENPMQPYEEEPEEDAVIPGYLEPDEPEPEEAEVSQAKPAAPARELPRARAHGADASSGRTFTDLSKPASVPRSKPKPVYQLPPIELLHEGKRSGGDSDAQLKETAVRLEEILKNYGVNARVTEISQGPTVTRYELQPEVGVKVSKILGLTDDIKLNLAATDIRIEAPIPGKAAVGIEVPNKINETVCFRDVVETTDFKAFKSKLAFGAGKNLEGKPVVADIAKMPHVLIAGATGSGKSVCINTIIMSILYKATPEEVKLIMVDPKVVELSVYNGIPHLLIPVVTEPQKAAAALNWAVAEMTKRYKLFADTGVRDLAGYNAHLDKLPEEERTGEQQKLPQILVIVDELADLMMTCAKDVESAIVRLTQLARAAGIHLVIATQRPSVDVITGLIKANMPSRIAFAVTSSTDSRTILDLVGAERLLGKGDMLFFPQGYTRPARVQGAFVSDEEVADVVAFIREQGYQTADSEQLAEELAGFESAGGNIGSGDSADGDERDTFFVDAARLVIGKEKASIGMIQRVYKVGFNRAARIMDQLCEAGVVSDDEGTKPRRVLMSEEEFNAYLNSGREKAG